MPYMHLVCHAENLEAANERFQEISEEPSNELTAWLTTNSDHTFPPGVTEPLGLGAGLNVPEGHVEAYLAESIDNTFAAALRDPTKSIPQSGVDFYAQFGYYPYELIDP